MAADPITSTLKARRTHQKLDFSRLTQPKQCIYNYVRIRIVHFQMNNQELQKMNILLEACASKYTPSYREGHCSNGALRLAKFCVAHRLLIIKQYPANLA